MTKIGTRKQVMAWEEGESWHGLRNKTLWKWEPEQGGWEHGHMTDEDVETERTAYTGSSSEGHFNEVLSTSIGLFCL